VYAVDGGIRITTTVQATLRLTIARATATVAHCSWRRSTSCSNNPNYWRNEPIVKVQNDIREEILSVLTTIAPQVEPDDIRDDVLLRDQVDLDSMDWLNFLVGIHKRLYVDIPEADYKSLRTLADVIGDVEKHAAARQ
jgi:acyl carrier protein